MGNWRCCVLLGMLLSGTASALEVLVPGYLQCPVEADLIDLVNAEPRHFHEAVMKKIDQQKCARIAQGERVHLVMQKRLPSGRSYSCYQEELGVLTPANQHCSLNQYFMPLETFLAENSLQFSVTARSAERLFARCANGAAVMLERRPGYYLRTVQLPFTGMVTAAPSEIRVEEGEALLGGCRGDDFLQRN